MKPMENRLGKAGKIIAFSLTTLLLQASPQALALSTSNSSMGNVHHTSGGQAYTLPSAAERLLPAGWKVLYSNNEYRNIMVRFSSSGKYTPRWTAIFDDVAKRFGVAMLISTQKKTVIVVPADEFKEAGNHFVQTNRLQHTNQYQWQFWIAQASMADGKYELALNEMAKKEKIRQQTRNQNEINRKVTLVKNDYAEKEKSLEQSYQIKVANLSKIKVKLSQAIVESEYKTKLLEESIQKNSDSTYLNDRESALLVVKQQKLEEERVALQSKFDAMVLQNKSELDNQMAQNKLELENQLQQNKQEQDQIMSEQQQLKSKLLKDAAEFKANKLKFYPETKRIMAEGRAEDVVKDFFANNWKYGVAWDESLLTSVQKSELRFDYPMNFDSENLYNDVSQIACALTRDVGGIVVAAEVKREQRVIYLQFHRASPKVKQQLLDECYK